MGEHKDRRIILAETLRSRAVVAHFPFRREQLLTLARMSENEAELVRLSLDCIVRSKDLIAQTEILLRRR